MMACLKRFLLSVFFYFLLCFSATGAAGLTLELYDASLTDAVRFVAGFLGVNVIISPSVRGTVTLNMKDAVPSQVFNMLLNAHGLARSQMGNIWYVAPREELIKQKQEELKWRDVANALSPLVTDVLQIRYARAEDVARLLQDEHASFMSTRGHVRVDTRTNLLCVRELPEYMEQIRMIVRRLDVPVRQISIEARIVSVDYDYERELGIGFTAVSQGASGIEAGVGQLRQETNHFSLALAKLADTSLLDVKLAALENTGHAEIISRPSLFAADQQAASIEAGEEVPYQEVSESGGTAVTFKKAVLGLKVTPQVLPGNKVLLKLQINQDRPGSKMVQGMPTISTRQIMTSVLVKNRQTIVLGGVYETNEETGQQRLPFISRIPLLGLLFQQRHNRNNKRELLIFVTPQIVAQEI
jgi:type IV pilus assembly protein PilQ